MSLLYPGVLKQPSDKGNNVVFSNLPKQQGCAIRRQKVSQELYSWDTWKGAVSIFYLKHALQSKMGIANYM